MSTPVSTSRVPPYQIDALCVNPNHSWASVTLRSCVCVCVCVFAVSVYIAYACLCVRVCCAGILARTCVCSRVYACIYVYGSSMGCFVCSGVSLGHVCTCVSCVYVCMHFWSNKEIRL